jgi:hypothetical protein
VPRAAHDHQLFVRIEPAEPPPEPTGVLKKLLSAQLLFERLQPKSYRTVLIEPGNDAAVVVRFNVWADGLGVFVRSFEVFPTSSRPRARHIRFPWDTYLQVVEHALGGGYSPRRRVYTISNGKILDRAGNNIRTPNSKDTKPRERRKPQPLSEKDLRDIAAVYRANPRRPKKAVAEDRGVSERTAARQIDQARAAGFLGPALKNRPGELTPARKSLVR